jgi:hypothetical protein
MIESVIRPYMAYQKILNNFFTGPFSESINKCLIIIIISYLQFTLLGHQKVRAIARVKHQTLREAAEKPREETKAKTTKPQRRY